MSAHPEGGHYVETYRADDASASLIFYLLQQGEGIGPIGLSGLYSQSAG